MAKVQFSKNTQSDEPSTEKEAKVVDAEVVGGEQSSVGVPAVVEEPMGISDSAEDVGLNEITLPKIHIAQSIGPLSESFERGQIVLNKELVIHDYDKNGKAEPVGITVIGFYPTRWSEKMTGGEMGRLLNSSAEVAAANGTTDYKTAETTGKPLFRQLETALVLVRKPSIVEDDSSFPFDIGKDKYALALWSMQGTAYTNGARIIRTNRRIGIHRRHGYTSHEYDVSTKLQKWANGNSAMIPVMKAGKAHDEAFRNALKNLLNGDAEEDRKGNIAGE